MADDCLFVLPFVCSLEHLFSATLNHCAARSLGGALSTLLAMKLASSWTVQNEITVKGPIVNISVALPYLGNEAFYNTVQVRLTFQ
jgi:hypothetical protein